MRRKRTVIAAVATVALAGGAFLAIRLLDQTILAKRAVAEAVKAGNRQDWQTAEENYTAAIRKLPESADFQDRALLAHAYSGRAIVREKMQRYTDAPEDISRSVQVEPESSYHLFLRGSIRLKVGQFDDAAVDFEEVFQRNDANSTAAYYRGLVAERQGDLPKAAEYFRKAIGTRIVPESAGRSDAKFHAALSRVLEKTGDTAGALAAANTARSLDQEVSFAFPDLGKLPLG